MSTKFNKTALNSLRTAQPSRFETSHREMKYIERELNDEKKIISFVSFSLAEHHTYSYSVQLIRL